MSLREEPALLKGAEGDAGATRRDHRQGVAEGGAADRLGDQVVGAELGGGGTIGADEDALRASFGGGGGVAFLVGEGGDACARDARDLHGELADAARGTGDQDVAVEE